jgi:hypothetical protein
MQRFSASGRSGKAQIESMRPVRGKTGIDGAICRSARQGRKLAPSLHDLNQKIQRQPLDMVAREPKANACA